MNLPAYLTLLFGAITAFIVAFLSIPSIIRVVEEKNLYDKPGARSSHSKVTPTLGGLAIFAGTVLSLSLWADLQNFHDFQFIVAAIIILFFIGIKDDILIIAPMTKLSGQILAALIVTILGNIRITNLHGFFQIYEIPYIVSIGLSIFTILVITNGLNLIDGIDGLSSGVGIVTSTTFGTWFYLIGEYQYALLSFCLVGSLSAFFRFNVFCKRHKIFMGDTGSLILGITLSIICIKFIEMNKIQDFKYAISSAPTVAFGILIVPLFDTLRIMFVRIVIRKALFKPDKNHIHHRLLKLGLSHRSSTFWILAVNIFFIIFSFYFQFISIRRLMLILLILGMIFSYIPSFIMEKKKLRKKAKFENLNI